MSAKFFPKIFKLDFEEKKLLSNIDPDIASYLKESNAMVAGGAISSVFTGREINDIDVYFPSWKDVALFLEIIEDTSYRLVGKTEKSILLKTDKDSKIIQLITFDVYKSPKDLFQSFDFTCVMGAYKFKTGKFYLADTFLKDNSQRILNFNPETSFPIISLMRVKKYERYGYSISRAQFLKIIFACMNLSLKNYKDLKYHMGGLYQVNMNTVFNVEEDESPVDWNHVYEVLSSLHTQKDYFSEYKELGFESVNIGDYSKFIFEVTRIPKRIFYLGQNAIYVPYSFQRADLPQFCKRMSLSQIRENPEMFVEFDADSLGIDTKKVYKYVQRKEDGKLYAFWNTSPRLEYIVGETVVPTVGDKQIYVVFRYGVENESNRKNSGGVLIEMEYDPKDIVSSPSTLGSVFTLKKAKVVRIVPEDEERKMLETGIEDDLPF